MRSIVGSLRLTPRGVALLAVAGVTFVAAPVLSLPVLQQVTGLMLGLLLLATGFVLLSHTTVSVDRSFDPEVVDPGSASRVRVRVRNLRAVPSTGGRWSDALPGALAGPARGLLPRLGRASSGRAETDVEYSIKGLRRGRHTVGPFSVEVEDPFGLVARRRSVGGTQEVVVLPRRTVLGSGALSARESGGASRPAPQHVGVGSDDVIARPYLPGDALKRVHWKATARRGELMVRQEEQQTDPRSAVLLDTDDHDFGTARDASGRWDHSPDLEWAVGAAASLVSYFADHGHDVTFRSVGLEAQRITDRSGSVDEILVSLAELEPSTGSAVTRESAATGERHVVVILGRVEPTRARAWTAALAGAGVSALVSANSQRSAVDVLEEAGWRVVTYRDGDDLAHRWVELGEGGRRAAS